jgi:hypothetical protein
VLLIALLLFTGVASAEEQHRVFRIPFHTVNAMILLDVKVNGNAAKLVLDTGSAVTIVSPKGYGETQVRSHSLSEDDAGPGYVGLAKHMRADLKLADGARLSVIVSVMSLEDASKHIGTKIDGILGQEVLRTFSAVRIDYENYVIELTSR